MVISQGDVAPEFFTHPASQKVSPGDEWSLKVNATGVPIPTYQWYRNGEILPRETSAELVFRPFRASLAGTYTCQAYNDAGVAESAPAIVSAGEPRLTLKLVSTGLTSITVREVWGCLFPLSWVLTLLVLQMSWEEPVVDHRIAAYVVEAKEYDDDPSDDAPPDYFEMNKTDFTFELFHGEPIDPGESFQFRVFFRYEGAMPKDWHGKCDPLIASTQGVAPDAVLLLSEPAPRIFMARPLLFERDSVRSVLVSVAVDGVSAPRCPLCSPGQAAGGVASRLAAGDEAAEEAKVAADCD
jgi:Immunoglobulin domain